MRMIDKNGHPTNAFLVLTRVADCADPHGFAPEYQRNGGDFSRLENMRGKGWVKNTLGPRGGVRWAITAAGVAALGRKPDDDTADEDRPRSYSDHWHEEVANDDRDFEDRYNG